MITFITTFDEINQFCRRFGRYSSVEHLQTNQVSVG